MPTSPIAAGNKAAIRVVNAAITHLDAVLTVGSTASIVATVRAIREHLAEIAEPTDCDGKPRVVVIHGQTLELAAAVNPESAP